MGKGLLRHLAALAGLVLIALFYCRPIGSQLSTHIIGPAGESAVGIWSLWYFRHALTVLHSNPFWTDHQYWPYGANLILHHYTVANDILGFILLSFFNMETAYNLILLSSLVLAGYGLLGLLRDWGFGWGPAFLAGSLFAFSPLTDWQIINGGGLDRLCTACIPFFVWTLSRAARDGRLRDCFLAALCLTWAWGINYYYFLFCVLLIPFFYVSLCRPFKLSLSARPQTPGVLLASRAAGFFLVLALLAALRSIAAGQREFHGAGGAPELLLYLAPYLAFWGILCLRLALHWNVKADRNAAAFERRALFPYAATAGLWTLLNLPLIAAALYSMVSGDYGATLKPWRGGGGALDPAWMFLPKTDHPLWGNMVLKLRALPGLSRIEAVSLGLAPLGAVAWLWTRRPRDRWVSLWFSGLAFSFILTLGPWLKLLGVHTYLPLPFYFLHLLPVYSNLQNGDKFSVFITLFESLLFAAALRELKSRVSPWVLALACAALALELWPLPRASYRLEFPALIRRLAFRPDGAMLTVPTGAVFDGIIASGGVGSMPDLKAQTVHHKPFVGGFLGRVARRTYEAMIHDPFWKGLVDAQAGAPVPEALKDRGRVARYFRQTRLSYVLVDSSRLPPALAGVLRRWPMRLIDSDGTLRLYAVSGGPS